MHQNLFSSSFLAMGKANLTQFYLLILVVVVCVASEVVMGRNINYGAIRRGNRIPCTSRGSGATKKNCRVGPPANNYTRGCSKATRCRGGTYSAGGDNEGADDEFAPATAPVPEGGDYSDDEFSPATAPAPREVPIPTSMSKTRMEEINV